METINFIAAPEELFNRSLTKILKSHAALEDIGCLIAFHRHLC